MYKFLVALRYLRRNWLNLVGMAAVAIAVLVLICVLSVMKGFDEEFRARLRATVSDLILERWTDETFEGYEALMERIERIPHIAACAPRFEGLALIHLETPYGKRRRFGQFHGIDLSREVQATDLADYWRAWRGREAREQVEDILSRNPAGLEKLSSEQISELLAGLRADDFELLSTGHRSAVRAALERTGLSLQVLFRQSVNASPEWGTVANPDRESPAFPGAELAVIGRDSAGKAVAVGVGERMVVFAPTGLFDRPAIRRCRIKGKFRSGLYDYDLRTIYLPLADVQRFMDKPGRVTSINIRLDSFDNAPTVRAVLLGILTPDELDEGLALLRPVLRPEDDAVFRDIIAQVHTLHAQSAAWFAEGDPQVIRRTVKAERDLFSLLAASVPRHRDATQASSHIAKLIAFQKRALDRQKNAIGPDFRVSTWEDKRRTFLRAVWLERRIMGFILFFVMLIAAFLILSILHTTVVAKTRDIGTLKAIGASTGGIMFIFLLNGLFIGIVGSFLGTGGGILITRNINKIERFLHRLFGFSLFPANVYYLDRVPVDRDPLWSTVCICLTAIVMSFLASAYPAWKASRMDPVEALRHE